MTKQTLLFLFSFLVISCNQQTDEFNKSEHLTSAEEHLIYFDQKSKSALIPKNSNFEIIDNKIKVTLPDDFEYITSNNDSKSNSSTVRKGSLPYQAIYIECNCTTGEGGCDPVLADFDGTLTPTCWEDGCSDCDMSYSLEWKYDLTGSKQTERVFLRHKGTELKHELVEPLKSIEGLEKGNWLNESEFSALSSLDMKALLGIKNLEEPGIQVSIPMIYNDQLFLLSVGLSELETSPNSFLITNGSVFVECLCSGEVDNCDKVESGSGPIRFYVCKKGDCDAKCVLSYEN